MVDGNIELTRRKILAGAGAIGVAGAGAGLGSSAFFSDQETFTNNSLVAGELDLKVSATSYYSDWSEDEAEHISMADPPDADFVLPAPPGLAGARDIAFDVDDGQAALNALSQNTVNGGLYNRGLCGTDNDADGQVIVELTDVKPGDWGIVGINLDLCDNPGYVWLTGDDVSRDENGYTEPEREDPDESGDADGDGADDRVELLDQVQVAVFRDLFNAQDLQSGQFSLRTFLELVNNDPGFPLIGDAAAETGGGTGRHCFSAADEVEDENAQDVFVVWWLPIDHGNEVQTDSVTFDLGLYTEQCRHNDGTGPTRQFDGAAVGGIDVQDQPLGDPIPLPGGSQTVGRLRVENVRYTGSTDALANAPPPIKQNATLIATLNDNVPAVDGSKEYFVIGLHTPGVGSSIPTRRDSLIGVAALPTDDHPNATGTYPDGVVMPVAPTPFTGDGDPTNGVEFDPTVLTGQKPVAATLWHGPVAPGASGLTGVIVDGDNDPYIDAAVVRFPDPVS